MSPRDFEASINGSKTNSMKQPPPQSGHLNPAFNLLAAELRMAGATSLRAIAAGLNENQIEKAALLGHGELHCLSATRDSWRSPARAPLTGRPVMP